jgi:spore coat protein H
MLRRSLLLCSLISACLSPTVPPTPPEGPDIFSLDKVHQINLEIDPLLLPQMDTNINTRVPANITFDGVLLENIGIRKKCGLSSCVSINDKTGFSIKFDEFEDDLRLSGRKKLILNNTVQDPSYSNELIGQEVARRAGVPAPLVAYASVTLNGNPYGFFVMTEAIDKQFLRKHFGEDNDEGNLYEGPCCADFVDNIVFPELKDEDDPRTRDDLQAFSDFIVFSDNQQFEEQIGDLLNIDGYLTQYAVSALTTHLDNYEYNTNNYYNYHNPADDTFNFWLHGMDFILFDCFFSVDTFPVGRLGQRVFSTASLRDGFHAEIERILDEVWNDDLLSFLDNTRNMYEAEARLDPTRPFDDFLFNNIRQCFIDRKDIVRQQLNAVCGDGILTNGEQCDDGNTSPDDGCSPVCLFECGDGNLNPGEECDDGNPFPDDGCSPECRNEPPFCGDGITAGIEECDDFRNGDNFFDGCRDDCTVNRCGDGLLDFNEGCDDTNLLNNDGCNANCQDEDNIAICGNGLLELGEGCDDGNQEDADACGNNCKRACDGGDNRAIAPFNGHCYVSFEFGASWQDAQNICQQAGGHLATISGAAEEGLVNDLSFNDPWIGLNDLAQEGNPIWVTGEALLFTHFAFNVPSNFSPILDCFNTSTNGWQDRSCEAALPFVCEIE